MKILIHTCCAPCLIYPYKRLKEEGFCAEVFYYNPNIHPHEEYLKRKQQVENYARQEDIKMREPYYEIKEFFRQVNHNEEAPSRCRLCWQLRLDETAKFTKENGFEIFTTTLLVSPYQNHEEVKETGDECAEKYGVEFYYEDFRKGYQGSVGESKKRNMYRQKYCGCLYSIGI